MIDSPISNRDQKRGVKWWLMLIFLWMPLGLTGLNMVVSANGVCISQARYWTDDELIEVAVRHLAQERYSNQRKRMTIDGTEESILEFLRDNPLCCEVNRYPHYRGMLDLLTGWNMPEVEVNYKKDFVWITSQNYTAYYKQPTMVSTCGEFVKASQGGTGTDTLETTRHTYQSK
jgi:hypothetical protein